MAVMKMNFGNVSMIRNERTYRQKEAYITAHNNTFNCKRITNDLNIVLDFKRQTNNNNILNTRYQSFTLFSLDIV